MAYVKNFASGLRTHWKKSILAVCALSYGASYTKEYLEIQQLMREYCERAAYYGKEPIATDENPRIVTVILNPNANKRKALKNFEKYCAPILYVAGICVDVVQTESEGHAKTLVETLSRTDAVIVAGGDGTLSEVVTGLFRKTNSNYINLPLGVLPLGRSNTIGNSFFPGGRSLQSVRSLADASMALIEKCTRPIDVMKIEVIDEEDAKGKAVYALSGIEWGAYRDAQSYKDKYWYFGPLRKYVTYIFNGYKNHLCWNCEASIKYSPPCAGCANCMHAQEGPQRRWYHTFWGRRQPERARVINDECKQVHEMKISSLDVGLLTTNTLSNMTDLPKLQLKLGPNSIDYLDFVKQGWQMENEGIRNVSEVIEAREIEIKPTITDQDDKWFSIDKENFEVRPVRITLLPKAIHMFCKNTTRAFT